MFKKTSILLFNCLLILVLLSTSIYAWYTNYVGFKAHDDIQLSSNTGYFAGGNGTKDNPYLISSAVHLYNLAWLQDLGYFDLEDDSNPNLEGNQRFYFELVSNIDMSKLINNNLISPIPPIGIDAHPFVSNFEGNGYIISNLFIETDFSNQAYIKPANDILQNSTTTILNSIINTSSVGLFGQIDTDDIDENNPMQVSNFIIDNAIINNSQEQGVTGIICGYANGNLNNVGVYQAKIEFINASANSTKFDENLSTYSLIGYKSDSTIWEDIPGKVEDYEFKASGIFGASGTNGADLGSGDNFNIEYPNHNVYDTNIFNVIGELKAYDCSGFIEYNATNGIYKKEYSYEGTNYTYEEDFSGQAIQFQDGIANNGLLRSNLDRHIRFHTDGKGKVFACFASNKTVNKQLQIYKANKKILDFTTNPTDIDNSYFTLYEYNDSSSPDTTLINPATTSPYEFVWVEIPINEAGDYIFAVDGGNSYLTYLRFIISNNQGNTGGDSNTHTLDNLGWIYSLNPTVDGEGNISVDVITFVIQPNSGFTSYSVKVIFDPREGIVYYNKLNDSINIIPSDSSRSQIDNSLT